MAISCSSLGFYLTCVRLSFLESFPSKQREETTALDGKTRRSNAWNNFTKFLSTTDVACFPVGATAASIDLQFLSPGKSNTQNYPVFWILPYLVGDPGNNGPSSIDNNTKDATMNSQTCGDEKDKTACIGVSSNDFIVGMNSRYSCYLQPNLTRPCWRYFPFQKSYNPNDEHIFGFGTSWISPKAVGFCLEHRLTTG